MSRRFKLRLRSTSEIDQPHSSLDNLAFTSKGTFMSSPVDLRFTKTHEWVRLDGDVATIGITDHAQKELGDITYVELPESGDAISQNQPFGIVESVKAASDIYAPLDGEVVERNETLLTAPDLVNSSPYDGLMAADVYDEFAEESA